MVDATPSAQLRDLRHQSIFALRTAIAPLSTFCARSSHKMADDGEDASDEALSNRFPLHTRPQVTLSHWSRRSSVLLPQRQWWRGHPRAHSLAKRRKPARVRPTAGPVSSLVWATPLPMFVQLRDTLSRRHRPHQTLTVFAGVLSIFRMGFGELALLPLLMQADWPMRAVTWLGRPTPRRETWSHAGQQNDGPNELEPGQSEQGDGLVGLPSEAVRRPVPSRRQREVQRESLRPSRSHQPWFVTVILRTRPNWRATLQFPLHYFRDSLVSSSTDRVRGSMCSFLGGFVVPSSASAFAGPRRRTLNLHSSVTGAPNTCRLLRSRTADCRREVWASDRRSP